jgi:hypothetical protein
MKPCSLNIPLYIEVNRRIANEHKRQYETFRSAIYDFLRRRTGFEECVDSPLVEVRARTDDCKNH